MNYFKIFIALIFALQPTLGYAQVSTKFKNNTVEIGDGKDTSTKNVVFDAGDTSKPLIRYSPTEKKIQFSNDGIIFKSIGSGSGSGSGINLLENGGFEDGVSSRWTYTSGEAVEEYDNAEVIFEQKSLTFTAEDTDARIESELVTIPRALEGQYCELSFRYATEANSFYVQVRDEDNVLIGGLASQHIPASLDVEKKSIIFKCPSTGKIKFTITNPAGSGSITLDTVHFGEATLITTIGKRAVGQVFFTAANACPSGSRLADGAAVSQGKYRYLYAAIGASHGNGSTNATGATADSGCPAGTGCFNVPDIRGRFVRGVAGNSTLDPDKASRTGQATGGNTGNNVGSVQGHAFQQHNHTQNEHFHPFGTTRAFDANGNTGGYIGKGNNGSNVESSWNSNISNGGIGGTTATNNVANAAGTTAQATANETRPVNIYELACIQFEPEGEKSVQAGDASQYAGEIFSHAGLVCPMGSADADGRAALREDYPDMFHQIGTAWGDGTKNPDGASSGISAGQGFNFPDARGVVLRGLTLASGRDQDATARTALISGGGGNAGNNVGTFQGHAFQTHNHTDSGHTHVQKVWAANANGGAIPAGFANVHTDQTGSYSTNTGYAAIQDKAASGSFSQATNKETRMVNVAVRYCVRLKTAKISLTIPNGVVSRDNPDTTVINTVVEKSTNYTASLNEETIVLNAAVTLTLPDVSIANGKKFEIVQLGSFASTVLPSSSQSICGQSSIQVSGNNDSILIQSTGTKWIGLNGSCRKIVRLEYSGGTLGTNCAASPCAAVMREGVGITVTRTSTGLYVINFPSGNFSGAPTCGVNFASPATPSSMIVGGSGVTATAFSFQSPQYDGIAKDSSGLIRCEGWR